MMLKFIRWRLILLCLPLMAFQTITNHVPPPLAFSHYYTDRSEHYDMDFATGDITTIQRTGVDRPSSTIYGETATPDEVLVPAPTDTSVQMVFINETGLGMMGDGGYYTLYYQRLDSERAALAGERIFVADHAKPTSPLDWSSDARFFYFLGDQTEDGLSVLYQYEIETETLATLLPDVIHTPSTSCKQDRTWCVIRSASTYDDYVQGKNILHILQMDTGDLRYINAISATIAWVWWHDNPPEVYASGEAYLCNMYMGIG